MSAVGAPTTCISESEAQAEEGVKGIVMDPVSTVGLVRRRRVDGCPFMQAVAQWVQVRDGQGPHQCTDR
jgi:hypothetical protein